MLIVWIALAVLATAAAAALVLRRAPPTVHAKTAARRTAAQARVAEPSPSPAPAPAAAPASPPPAMPPELAAFTLQKASGLSATRQAVFASVFRDIPRPPKLLQHLLSPDFVGQASSAQLVDLITAEPLISAKVLAAVNSPLYGLKAPVSGISQAVLLLGLDTVRSVCLQYLLISSFKADTPERQQMLDRLWAASAMAGELTHRLAPALGFEQHGSLVSSVVLSFLGRLAVTATVPRNALASIAAGGLLERTMAEQSRLGLGAAEIGRLLMDDWGLPKTIVQDAADIDLLLVTPCAGIDIERESRQALCYLCLRLAERLADGEDTVLQAFDVQAGLPASLQADTFHLRGYLAAPRWSPLTPLLRSPELGDALQKMALATRR